MTAESDRGAALALALCQQQDIRFCPSERGEPSCGSGRIWPMAAFRGFTGGEGKTTALLRRHGIAVFSEDQLPELAPGPPWLPGIGLSRRIAASTGASTSSFLPALVQPRLETALELFVIEVHPLPASSTGSPRSAPECAYIRPIRKSLNGVCAVRITDGDADQAVEPIAPWRPA